MIDIRLRWARMKFYLHLYNNLLRYTTQHSRAQDIIRYINKLWDTMSEAEHKYILLHEDW